jgi:hypothetical protein
LVVAAPVIDKDATGHNVLGVCSIAPHVARENSMESICAQQRRMVTYHAAACLSLQANSAPKRVAGWICLPHRAFARRTPKRLGVIP